MNAKGDNNVDGFGFSTDQENVQSPEQWRDLDDKLWSWKDTDQYAKASASFTSAGFAASSRAQTTTLVFGIMSVLWVIFNVAILKYPITYGMLAIVCAGFWFLGIFLLPRLRQTRRAIQWVKFGLVPSWIFFVLQAYCTCDCSANTGLQMCIAYRNNATQPRECAAALLQPESQSDEGSGSGSFDADEIMPSYTMYELCTVFFFHGISYLLLILFFNVSHGKWHLVGALVAVVLTTGVQGLFGVLTVSTTAAKVYCGIAVVGIFALIWTVWTRWKAVTAAYALVATDRARYDNIWDTHLARQSNVSLAKEELDKAWIDAMVPKTSQEQPTNRLAKLYYHASSVNSWYQKKVEHWHSKIKREKKNNINSFTHTSIKSVERTIEKARRVYFGIVANVCDIVRASIVVSTLDDARLLFQLIAEDPDVEIVRGKNRFLSGSSAKKSGGYRDLQLSLRLVGFNGMLDDATASLSCKQHIAEMQIHLDEIYKIKMEDGEGDAELYINEPELQTGHGRYARFRTLIGL